MQPFHSKGSLSEPFFSAWLLLQPEAKLSASLSFLPPSSSRVASDITFGKSGENKGYNRSCNPVASLKNASSTLHMRRI